jgi:very-short-patch-repair endonuclease
LAGELPRGPRRFHPGNKEAAGLRASAGHVVNFDILQSFGWYFVATELEMNSQATEYLTEASLGRFLRERVDPAIVAGQLISGISRRYQPDFRSEGHRLIVEFDGDDHYRSAKKILGDEERDRALASVGYRIVRIPYFVQLTRVVIATLFGEIAMHHGDFLNFPHGFIAKTVVMPANLCELS